MKKLLINIIILLLLFSSNAFSQVPCEGQNIMPVVSFDICNYSPWVLVLEDNFEGSSLDLSKWDAWTGVPRDHTFDKQKAWHKPENVVVENGLLKIITKEEFLENKCFWSYDLNKEVCSDFEYTTGEIWTKYKFGYGKYEAKVKIPKGKGFWPAFWLFGDDPVYNEIDIFEFMNVSPSLSSREHSMNVWYDYGEGREDCSTDYIGDDFSKDFHIFTLIWERDKIQFYVDGDLKRTDYRYYYIDGSIVGCYIEAYTHYILNLIYPQDPMHIILNLAIQSGENAPDPDTPFPSQMEVEWVRYYKRENCLGIINITDISDIEDFFDGAYNIIFGTTINIYENFTLSSDQHLEVVARDEIILGPGFHSKKGSNFLARIDPTICNRNNQNINITDNLYTYNNVEEEYTSDTIFINQKNVTKKSSNVNFDVKVFPNPTRSNLFIEFNPESAHYYEFHIIDLRGNVVYSSDLVTNSYEINIRHFDAGIYFLHIIDNKNKNKYIHKIVKK